jgi:hypothetical protein
MRFEPIRFSPSRGNKEKGPDLSIQPASLYIH